MKFVLIVFAAFHYDGGVSSATVEFSRLTACEQAKKTLINEHGKYGEGWGKQKMTVICVAK